jgi:hypothetical protein
VASMGRDRAGSGSGPYEMLPKTDGVMMGPASGDGIVGGGIEKLVSSASRGISGSQNPRSALCLNGRAWNGRGATAFANQGAHRHA